jgi:hypothetical protein
MGRKEQSFETTVDVCCHRVAVRFWGFTSKLTPELEAHLTEEGEIRAQECIIDGCHSGQLVAFNPDTEEEIHGWYEIERD